jgi:actin-like protein 6A
MCELMFEKFQAPATFLSRDAVLSAYACGKTGGLVIDIGASGTLATPVQDGWVDPKGMCRTLAGSRMIDLHIQENIFKKVLLVWCLSLCLQFSIFGRFIGILYP